MPTTRIRITFAITLFFAGAAVIGNRYPLAVGLTLWALAAFFFFWGREPAETDALIGRLWGGRYLLKGLHQLDVALNIGDEQRQAALAALGQVLKYVQELSSRQVSSDHAYPVGWHSSDHAKSLTKYLTKTVAMNALSSHENWPYQPLPWRRVSRSRQKAPRLLAFQFAQ